MLGICIGYDKYQKPLYEGDICKYTFTDEHGVTNTYKGMVLYDSTEYQFVFEQLEDDFPLLWMGKANLGTIEKIMSARGMDNSFPDYKKWKDIFNSNLGVIE